MRAKQAAQRTAHLSPPHPRVPPRFPHCPPAQHLYHTTSSHPRIPTSPADNEKLYGLNPVIGSASFGVPRDFILRRNADRSQKVPFHLGPGDLLVMGGTCQHTWQHSVPPRRRVEGARINLTFRTIVAREASDA